MWEGGVVVCVIYDYDGVWYAVLWWISKMTTGVGEREVDFATTQ